jgi:Putative peptidoglycan binding domain
MRSLGGLVLLAGIGVGLFVYLPTPVDSNTSLSRLHQLAAARAPLAPQSRVVEPPALRRLSGFSPAFPLTTLARAETPDPVSETTAPAPAQFDASGGWQSVVATSGNQDSRGASLTPSDPNARYKLITEIQQQLKRLGCYYGRIDGSWGANSKDAMKTFMDRVNATLPMDDPDYLLLTLLQTHNGRTCGDCPPGLEFSADGRCLPQPTVAQSRPGDGLRTAAVTGEALPWKGVGAAAQQTASRPLFTPLPTSAVSSEPLPGRMAIGGPGDLPPVDSLNTAPAYDGTGFAPQAVAATPVQAAGPPAATTQQVSTRAPEKDRSSYRRSRHSEGPGSPRYNLMLSLGGVY